MKRAIVFGASGDMGARIAQDMAAQGWSLYLHYSRQKKRVVELAKQLQRQYNGQDFFVSRLDFLASDQELTAFVEQLFPVNAVIFAQGVTDYHLLIDQSLTAIGQVMRVNLETPIKLTKLLEPQLLRYPHARIIYLGSVYGANGSALEAAYSASKAGISRFAQAAGREVAASGLTLNVIAPGAIDTQMNAQFSPAVKKEIQSEIPAARWGQSDDISFWVENLLNEKSDYLTGQSLYVTGGWLE